MAAIFSLQRLCVFQVAILSTSCCASGSKVGDVVAFRSYFRIRFALLLLICLLMGLMSSCSRHVEGGSLLLFTGEVVPVVVVVAFLTVVVARSLPLRLVWQFGRC